MAKGNKEMHVSYVHVTVYQTESLFLHVFLRLRWPKILCFLLVRAFLNRGALGAEIWEGDERRKSSILRVRWFQVL